MISRENARKIVLDDDYLLAAYENSTISIIGYDPMHDGYENEVSILFSEDPDSIVFELFLPLKDNWMMSINDEFGATRTLMKQVFKSKFFKRVRDEILLKLKDIEDDPSIGDFTWVEYGGKRYSGTYDEYRDCITHAQKALMNPARYIDRRMIDEDEFIKEDGYSGRNLVKYAASGFNPQYDPERIRRKENIDSYHLKQLPYLLKKVFPSSFESVEARKDSFGRVKLLFKVDAPKIRISKATIPQRVSMLVPELRRILDYIKRSQNITVKESDVTAINISFLKSNDLTEGECGAVSAGAIDCSPIGSSGENGISTEDVLGKFDPKKGCMGKGDFHLPKVLNLGSRLSRKTKNKLTGNAKVKDYRNISENDSTELNPILVYNLPLDRIEEILDRTEIENPRYDRSLLTKLIANGRNENVEYVGLFSKFPRECFGMAVLEFDRVGIEDCYINEILSFKRGYGKDLLLKILRHLKNTWLLCNPEQEETLADYYRQPCFGFKEYVLKNSCWKGVDAHFFYTKTCDEAKLIEYINRTMKNS